MAKLVLPMPRVLPAPLVPFTLCALQEPADYPDKRGQLIRDFEHYLGILKAVHSGADLQASAKAAGHCLPSGAKGHLGYVLASLGSNQARAPSPPPLRKPLHPRDNFGRCFVYSVGYASLECLRC